MITLPIAMQRFIIDLAKRAGHTFWQSFSGAFVVLLGGSALDVAQVSDLAELKKVVLSLAFATAAAFLSAVKTTIAGLKDARYSGADAKAVTEIQAKALARLNEDPDDELEDLPDEEEPVPATPNGEVYSGKHRTELG